MIYQDKYHVIETHVRKLSENNRTVDDITKDTPLLNQTYAIKEFNSHLFNPGNITEFKTPGNYSLNIKFTPNNSEHNQVFNKSYLVISDGDYILTIIQS